MYREKSLEWASIYIKARQSRRVPFVMLYIYLLLYHYLLPSRHHLLQRHCRRAHLYYVHTFIIRTSSASCAYRRRARWSVRYIALKFILLLWLLCTPSVRPNKRRRETTTVYYCDIYIYKDGGLFGLICLNQRRGGEGEIWTGWRHDNAGEIERVRVIERKWVGEKICTRIHAWSVEEPLCVRFVKLDLDVFECTLYYYIVVSYKPQSYT